MSLRIGIDLMIEYKKSSAILIFNDKGKLALQLRSKNDDSFPFHWDFAAGGGVNQGENPKESAARELKEELGVVRDLEFLSQEYFQYPAWKPGVTREVDLFIYKTKNNGPFKIDPIEIDKVDFFSFEKIRDMIRVGQKFHPEFILAWKKGLIR